MINQQIASGKYFLKKLIFFKNMLKDRGKMGYDNCLSSIIIMVQRHWRNYYFLVCIVSL